MCASKYSFLFWLFVAFESSEIYLSDLQPAIVSSEFSCSLLLTCNINLYHHEPLLWNWYMANILYFLFSSSLIVYFSPHFCFSVFHYFYLVRLLWQPFETIVKNVNSFLNIVISIERIPFLLIKHMSLRQAQFRGAPKRQVQSV